MSNGGSPEMPEFTAIAVWQAAPDGYQPVEYGSVYPPVRKLPGGALIIDQCLNCRGGVEIRVFDNKDHPNAALLPANTPRAVKALYRREWQLRYLRATDASGLLADIKQAEAAWNSFWDSRRPEEQTLA